MLLDINLLAVLVASVLMMVLGFLWYSPFLFGKLWMKGMGMNPKDMSDPKCMALAKKGYLASFLGGLVTAFVFGLMIQGLLIEGFREALFMAVTIWLGFFLAPTVCSIFFEKKSVTIYLINMGFQLAAFVLTSLVMFWWMY